MTIEPHPESSRRGGASGVSQAGGPARPALAGVALVVLGLVVFVCGLLLYLTASSPSNAALSSAGADQLHGELLRLRRLVRHGGYLLMSVGFGCVLVYRVALWRGRASSETTTGDPRAPE